MRGFITSVLLFFCILLALLLTLGSNWHFRNSSSDYLAAIIDKHMRLDHTKPPRLILAGGSNLAFGIDSKRIEDSTGFPVVNLGLHAGLGLEFIVNELRSVVKPNDIVLFSIEYTMDEKGRYKLKKSAADYFQPAAGYFSENFSEKVDFYLYYELGQNIGNNVSTCFGLLPVGEAQTSAAYSRASFNEFGDAVGHLEMSKSPNKRDKQIKSIDMQQITKLLNGFADFAGKQQVKCFFLFPDFPESLFYKYQPKIQEYAAYIHANLKMKTLNTPDSFCFPDSLFFDTAYHLTKEGRERRTNLLIEILLANEIVKYPAHKD